MDRDETEKWMQKGKYMKADFLLWSGTRVAIGMGAGLLCSRRMNNDQRLAAGVALLALGGFVTVPMILKYTCHKRDWQSQHEHHAEHDQAHGQPQPQPQAG